MNSHPSKLACWLTLAILVVMIWSGVRPHDRLTWFLEVVPVLIGLPLMLFTARRFPFTMLVCVLMTVHAVILMVGGKYTYAEVPAGRWVSDLFGWTRNNYDKLGHLAQGFVPAMIMRELLLRTSPIKKSGKWLVFIILFVCMGLSATYELVEWGTALAAGADSEAFLGTQGNPWDTQEDMCMAGIGAATALATLSALHDRQLGRLRNGSVISGETFVEGWND